MRDLTAQTAPRLAGHQPVKELHDQIDFVLDHLNMGNRVAILLLEDHNTSPVFCHPEGPPRLAGWHFLFPTSLHISQTQKNASSP
jgi:hypothetical protein